MRNELHGAIWRRDPDAVRTLLDAGVDVNARDRRGWSALARAIERREVAIAEHLLDRGADVDSRDRRGRTPLFWVARYGPVHLARRLHPTRTDGVRRDEMGGSALVLAIRQGQTEVAELLLDHPWSDWPGSRHVLSGCQQIAVQHRRYRLLPTIRKAHDAACASMSRPNFRVTRDYQDCLLLIAAVKNADIRMIDLLVDLGAKVIHPLRRPSPLAVSLERYGEKHPVTQALLRHGAQITLEDAILGASLSLAERLLVAGADVESANMAGETLLLWAITNRRPDAARLLVRSGANVNVDRPYTHEALRRAAAIGDVDLLQFLLQHGATVSDAHPILSPLAVAAFNGHRDTARWWIDRFGLGADRGAAAMTGAVGSRKIEMVHFPLDAGATPNPPRSSKNNTALCRAAWRGDVEMTRLLLEHGADIDGVENGRTALWFAAATGHRQVTRLLLDWGYSSAQRAQALIAALYGGHLPAAQILIDSEPDLHFAERDGTTPLMAASGHVNEILVQELLDRGAPVDPVDAKGRTAAERAEQVGHAALAARLRQWPAS